MSALTFRRSGTAVASSSSAALSPLPGTFDTDYFAGDLLLLPTINRAAAQTVAAITGWTQIYAQTAQCSIELWARIADGGANDAPSVDWSGSTRAVAWIDVFYGDVQTVLASLLHASNVGTGSASTVPALPTLTNASNSFTAANCLLYAIGTKKASAAGDATAVVAPAGMTLSGSYINNSASGLDLGTAYVQQTTQTDWGGADFSLTETTPESINYAGVVLALNTLSAPDWTAVPSMTSQTATAYTAGFTANKAATVYGVAVVAGDTAPSVAQIKAGHNAADATAKAAANKSVTGADTLVLTPSDSPAFVKYDLHFVLTNAAGDSSRQSLASEFLDPPTGKQFKVLTSVAATSPLYGKTPALVADDVWVTDAVTTGGGYVITLNADGTFSVAAGGDTSWQWFAHDVYDADVGAYYGAGTVNVNNQAPNVVGDSSYIFGEDVYQIGVDPAIDLSALFEDAEGQDIDWSIVSGALPTGWVLTGETGAISTGATAYGPFTFGLRAIDAIGDYLDTTNTVYIGDLVPDVVDTAQAAAVSTIEAVASMTAVVGSSQSSSTIAAGNVISQDPAAGVLVAPTQEVSLTISLGPVDQSNAGFTFTFWF